MKTEPLIQNPQKGGQNENENYSAYAALGLIELLIATFSYIGMIVAEEFSLIAAFVYLCSCLTSSVKELINRNCRFAGINYITFLIAFIGIILCMLAFHTSGNGYVDAIKFLLLCTPFRITIYTVIYFKKR